MLVRGNAMALPLADESVDLIVTSPPYLGLRDYKDGDESLEGQIGSEATPEEFIAALIAVTRECVRVLKPSGSLFVNLGDKYAGSNGQAGGASQLSGATYSPDGTRTKDAKRGGYVPKTDIRRKSLMGLPWRYALACVDDLDLVLRSEIIWWKRNALPESVTDRVGRRHEHVFHITKEERYYSSVDAIRERYTAPPAKAQKSKVTDAGQSKNPAIKLDHDLEHNPLGKLPSSVWDIPTQPLLVPDHLDVDHFAAFPTELPRRCIMGWSPPNGVVLDPFGGTGTTAMVAEALGRRGVSLDLSGDYIDFARWRTANMTQRAAVRAACYRDQQGTLFDI